MFSRVLPIAIRHFLRPKVVVPLITISTFSFYQAFSYKVKLEAAPSTPQYYEVSIEDDLKEGEVRELQVGPAKEDVVLVIKVEDQYYCVQSSCPHAGLPLGKGTLVGDKLICPFHNASFSVISGYTEGGPAFDGLTHYIIEKNEGKLNIKVDKEKLNKSTTMPMSKRNPNDHRRFVIVGGGPAALSCAETLRQSGYEGAITIISDEDTTTYDRTLMSKWIFGASIDKLLLRKEDFFQNNDIEFVKNTRITHIDYDHNELLTQDFHSIKYDKLLLATGGSPRRPNISGHDLGNVLVLRNHNDQAKLQKALGAGNVGNIVVIGASFIGMETAAAIKKELKDKVNITVVDVVKTPFERSLGKEVGKALEALHRANGINFILEKGVQSFNGKEHIESVTLADGTNISADLVILGTGIAPNTALAQNNLKIDPKNGGIETDVFLKTTKENVYAAGDVASFPYWVSGDNVRIEHYNEAIHQGSVAAFNMLGKFVPMDSVPFFWTRQWDKGLQYTGFAGNYDDLYIDGDVNAQNFAAYYLKNDKVVAVAAMNRMNLIQLSNEALRLNVMPSGAEIREGKGNLQELRTRITAKKPRCNKANCCRNK